MHKSGFSNVLVVVIVAVCLLSASTSFAAARLPAIFGSHMVLQQDMPIVVWGWADAGEKVVVELDRQKVETVAAPEGAWKVELAKRRAGGPFVMTITAGNKIQFDDVLVGEVWLCSGQSNMEMGVGATEKGGEEIAEANYPSIRLFDVSKKTSGRSRSNLEGEWLVCTSQNLGRDGWGGFSATAYYFGKKIHKELNLPVGLIDSSWGGSRIEPWTPPVGFTLAANMEGITKTIGEANTQYTRVVKESLDKIEQWVEESRTALNQNKDLPEAIDLPRHSLNEYSAPTSMYNAMIHPLVPFRIRGAIWYQGEANLGEGMFYYERMKALIGGWRKIWGEGDFPFYFVQLAPFRYNQSLNLPGIWEAQVASLSIPNTGMAVTVDIVHNIADIHPINKKDVGGRLALWALAKTYGKTDIVYSGPLYKTMTVEGDKIRIDFDHVGGGLTTRDGKAPIDFQIAGSDKKFTSANAKIENNTLVVWSDEVKEPAAVRFAWNEESQPNLCNKEGLPASPFRTDRW